VFQSYPVFATLLAVLLVGESLRRVKWLAALLLVGGAMLTSMNPVKIGKGLRIRDRLPFLLLGPGLPRAG